MTDADLPAGDRAGVTPAGAPVDLGTVVVAGLGASGQSVVRALATRAAKVVGLDTNAEAVARLTTEMADIDGPAAINLVDVTTNEAMADVAIETHPDVVVVSPGIPMHAPIYRSAANAGIPVWSEVELAWRLQTPRPDGSRAPWLTVTGTNGKTTAVTMLSAILTHAGLAAPAVGNVGTPIVEIVTGPDSASLDVLAVEVSSFQLHSTHSVMPHASACLNIAPDHLDWHQTFEAYREAKARVYHGTKDLCVYNDDDVATRRMVEEADVQEGARAVGISQRPPTIGQVGVVEDIVIDRATGEDRASHGLELFTRADLAHLAGGDPAAVGDHLMVDAMVAATLARAAGVDPTHISQALQHFHLADHRAHLVAQRGEVTYINDSKATNAHAAASAVQALDPGRVVWIAGGLAKGADFSHLVSQVADRLRGVVIIGTDPAPIETAVTRHAPDVPYIVVNSAHDGVMARAVTEATALAQPGDTVILAPACASWDQFSNFAERGDAFTYAVMAGAEGGRET